MTVGAFIAVGAAIPLVATANAPADRPAQSALRATVSPGFAAQLASTPLISGPANWPTADYKVLRARLATATSATRQAARWALARSLIATGRGPEAAGVLSVMGASEPDLVLVPAFRLATAAADIEAGHGGQALGLDDNALAADPEACAWRLRGFAALGRFDAAFGQFRCALPALNARKPGARAPFLYAAAQAALATRHADAVGPLLRVLPATDPAAGLLRGRAALAAGDHATAQRELAAVRLNGNPKQRIDGEISLLEADVAKGKPIDAATLKQIDHLGFTWRGDALERRVLRLSYAIGVRRGDLRRSLAAGATLVRRFDLGDELAPLLAALQASLAAGLAPGSAMPIEQAAGLYWDFRDLAPAGAAGDYLVGQLADRLQEHGLYQRAAELLRHQLTVRANDIAQGPLSVRVATLFILAGHPDAALEAMKRSDAPAYPGDMLAERHRVEAVALYKLGRSPEALAVLQDVPDAALLRAEIYWKRRDWPALAAETEGRLPAAARLSDVEAAIVLRHAIALAMLGREAALAGLRARYQPAFVGLPGAATFDVLTRAPGTIDAQALSAAMMKIPSASPAGRIGDLFDATVAAPRAAGVPPAI